MGTKVKQYLIKIQPSREIKINNSWPKGKIFLVGVYYIEGAVRGVERKHGADILSWS
jgi:hypothetical protein